MTPEGFPFFWKAGNGAIPRNFLELEHSMPNPHNCASVDGSCLDCGAERIEIDDGFAPACEKVTGPNRLAILAVARVVRSLDHAIGQMKSRITSHENSIALAHNEISERSAERRTLLASIAVLKGEESDKPLPLAEAIGRL